MNLVGILLAIITVGTLLYAAFVLLKERLVPGNKDAGNAAPGESMPVLPFVATTQTVQPAETRRISTNSFEDYVAARFDEKYFTIDNSDNLSDFALNIKPDLAFIYHDSFKSIRFSVECKYRPAFSKENTLIISTEQLDSYKFYQQENKIPVYFIIGIGGAADAPDRIYILPLKDIPAKENVLSASFLAKYRKFSVGSNFFFHPELMVLR